MKLFWTIILSLGLILGGSGKNILAASASTFESKAILITQQYVEALFLGDVKTISNLVAGNLRDSKLRIMSSSGYPEFLRAHYNNSKYEIVNTVARGLKQVIVDVKITLQNHEIVEFSLWIKDNPDKGAFIFQEMEVNM